MPRESQCYPRLQAYHRLSPKEPQCGSTSRDVQVLLPGVLHAPNPPWILTFVTLLLLLCGGASNLFASDRVQATIVTSAGSTTTGWQPAGAELNTWTVGMMGLFNKASYLSRSDANHAVRLAQQDNQCVAQLACFLGLE